MELGTERYFEDVEVGSELPTITKEISIEQLGMYAAVCWDFRADHYDTKTAQEYGFQAPYADGPMITAFLGQVNLYQNDFIEGFCQFLVSHDGTA